MINSKKNALEKSIQELGFGNKLFKMPLVNVAVETMKLLLDGHPKAMKITRSTIKRYAASLLGYFRGKFNLPKSRITVHKKLDTFIKLFVENLFISNGKLKNVKLFTQLFGVDFLEERVSINRLRKHPTPEVILKYSIQKRPISNFKSESNLSNLRKMTVNNIKLLLTPRGRFNPKLGSLDEMRARQHAITLTKKFAKTVNASKRMALSTLIEQLQKTENLNKELLQNIRKYSL